MGPRRCKKPRRRGQCDLCGLLSGVRAIETTRHLALECPYTTLTLEAVLRPVLESTTLDEAVLEEVRGMGREQLIHEYRRLCITGFRLITGRAEAEGRIGATPTRVIMLETLAGIVRRRHRNARHHELAGLPDGAGLVPMDPAEVSDQSEPRRRAARDHQPACRPGPSTVRRKSRHLK